MRSRERWRETQSQGERGQTEREKEVQRYPDEWAELETEAETGMDQVTDTQTHGSQEQTEAEGSLQRSAETEGRQRPRQKQSAVETRLETEAAKWGQRQTGAARPSDRDRQSGMRTDMGNHGRREGEAEQRGSQERRG